jgi:uncharacterized protein (TIGR02301 family)
MPSRKTAVLLAMMVCASAIPSATAQNLLERSTEPPRYGEPQEQWAPPPPPRAPAPLPAAPRPNPVALPGIETGKPSSAPAASPAAPEPAPPYEPQLLRLSELLGALTYLQDLCGGQGGQIWRDKMSALIDAETQDQTRKERLAGAYNRGFHGYELSYRQCTPNAQEVITRFLDESGKIARDVSHRYGTS